MKSTKEMFVIVVALVGIATIVNHCVGCLTPNQASSATHLACTLVEAYAGTPQVESICATAPEIAELATSAVEAMMAARSDSGARMNASCKHIPDTGTCATDAELAIAIRAVKAGRK